MDDVKKMITAIGAMAEIASVFRAGLRKHGVPRKEATQLTESFLRELLQLTKFKEDN